MATSLAPAADPARYQYLGPFNRSVLEREFVLRFRGSAYYDHTTVPALLALVGFMEKDADVRDLRWMAYMLATVMHETKTLKSEYVPVLDRKGRPVLDPKSRQPLRRRRRQWMVTMAPVGEVGRGEGRRYWHSVKVTRLPDGRARVVEQDGDVFTVGIDGRYTTQKPGMKMGVSPTRTTAADVYDTDSGVAQSYFGRGYVQLTWWENYARTGARIGLGLELLFDPSLAMDAQTAYRIMAYGMRTGHGFANGKRFEQFFHASLTDYVGARAMVNGSDKAEAIAELARAFEAILTEARL